VTGISSTLSRRSLLAGLAAVIASIDTIVAIARTLTICVALARRAFSGFRLQVSREANACVPRPTSRFERAATRISK
jgi:hypothetical protein